MVTISGKQQLSHQSGRCLLTFHTTGLCHLIRMQGSLGKQVFLAGQIAPSSKSQSPIDKGRVLGRN